jgi:hypothetical protein
MSKVLNDALNSDQVTLVPLGFFIPKGELFVYDVIDGYNDNRVDN